MKLPRKVTVSGYTVKIKYAPKIFVNKDECYGVYDTPSKTITLSKNMNPQRKKEIFLHEFTHFLEDIYRIRISEENVSNVALGYLQLLTQYNIEWGGGSASPSKSK